MHVLLDTNSYAEQRPALLGGGHAFILTGVASSWPAMEAWAGEVGRALARLWTVLVRA